MIECEICKAKGKQIYFFTFQDYCNHVNACHCCEASETVVIDLTEAFDRLFNAEC